MATGLEEISQTTNKPKEREECLPLTPSLSLLLCTSTLFNEGHSNEVWVLLKKLQKIIVSKTTIAVVTVTLATVTRATAATATLPVLHVVVIR